MIIMNIIQIIIYKVLMNKFKLIKSKKKIKIKTIKFLKKIFLHSD